jgi:hypothetical protein
VSVPVPKSVRFPRSERWALYIIGIGVWLSGGLWLLFHCFFVERGEFGPKVHPLEPWWLKLHGAFALASIWIFGLLWGVHVSRAWPGMRSRWSGGALAGVFAWLVLSGYLLYYVGDETARSVISALHWGIGLASPVCFGLHRVRLRKRREAPRSRTKAEMAGSYDPLPSKTERLTR